MSSLLNSLDKSYLRLATEKGSSRLLRNVYCIYLVYLQTVNTKMTVFVRALYTSSPELFCCSIDTELVFFIVNWWMVVLEKTMWL